MITLIFNLAAAKTLYGLHFVASYRKKLKKQVGPVIARKQSKQVKELSYFYRRAYGVVCGGVFVY